jgi:hypothetical protein
MLRRIREPFGKAGVIVAIVALVAALGGGAYAASGGLTGKQKKEVEKISKQFAGKNGKNGPAGEKGATGGQGAPGEKGAAGGQGATGDQGAPGQKGDAGPKGDAGSKGEPGESPTVVALASGEDPKCPEGGTKVIGVSGEISYACNGASGGGGGGYVETLPPGKTETGMWQGGEKLGVNFGESTLSVISFPLRLAVAPAHVVILAEEPTQVEEQMCPGSFENPKAAPGSLCLYTFSGLPELSQSGLHTIGADIFLANNEFGPATGSWAVTAEEG